MGWEGLRGREDKVEEEEEEEGEAKHDSTKLLAEPLVCSGLAGTRRAQGGLKNPCGRWSRFHSSPCCIDTFPLGGRWSRGYSRDPTVTMPGLHQVIHPGCVASLEAIRSVKAEGQGVRVFNLFQFSSCIESQPGTVLLPFLYLLPS